MQKLAILLLISMFALLAVACGSEAQAETPVVTANVEALDTLRFAPETLTVAAGSRINLTLNNTGGLEHNLVVVAADADPMTVTVDDALANGATDNVAGGESQTIRFDAPPAGSYLYVCTIPGHAAAGMVGELTVSE